VSHTSSYLSRLTGFVPSPERPVMTEAQMRKLSEVILSMTTLDQAWITIEHSARVVTRIANDRVLATEDGSTIQLMIDVTDHNRNGVGLWTNQVTEGTLRALVQRADAMARAQMGNDEGAITAAPTVQDEIKPADLWRPATITAMHESRNTAVPTLIHGVTRRGLRAAGFVGLIAKSQSVLTREALHGYSEQTDCEVTMTARSADGRSSGWAGAANRDWSLIDVASIANDAAEMCIKNTGAVALEPGRRTAILGPAAVAQMMRYLNYEFDAEETDNGRTAFSKSPAGGNKLHQRVFDPRITMRSDPWDPDGGYPSSNGPFANPGKTWVENGVLKDMAYGVGYAMTKGKAYTSRPYSLRIEGGTTTLEQMIAQCKEGIYVNRFSSVDMIDARTGMMTGVTRDGCFYVKDGKINRPVKNFRFLESPFFILNKLVAIGPTHRAAFGYTPPGNPDYDPLDAQGQLPWPRHPMIVPPFMVEDFNFSALADAV